MVSQVTKGEKNICPICGKENINIWAEREGSDYPKFFCYGCQSCGIFYADSNWDYQYTSQGQDTYGYDMKKLKSYLFYYQNKKKEKPLILPAGGNNEIDKKGFINLTYNLTPEMVENWYPKTFAEKIDKILLWTGNSSKFVGEKVPIQLEQLDGLFFMYNELSSKEWNAEFGFMIKYLIGKDYIVNPYDKIETLFANIGIKQNMSLSLTDKGWARVDELQKAQSNNKNVFVAMSFHKSADNIREAIKKGIEGAKYSSEIMDEVIHNHQIVPEMMRLIRECRFMIMDITQPNFGAYYEAGYAQGLGKEVIVTCSKEVWNKKDFTCDKDKDCKYIQISTKPHFDIAQKQILVWDDYDDLTKKLKEWIEFIIGTI